MTLLEERADTARAAPVRSPGLFQDLALGIRFAVSGGREGWIRTLLTAVGVGLGVALLLGAASVPTLLQQRDDRSTARQLGIREDGGETPRSDRSFLLTDASSDWRDLNVGGYFLRPEGRHPVLPPGVDRMPGPGEMTVSPALRRLLASSEGKLLKERYPYRDVGTIGKAGLNDPFDLYLYVGSDKLTYDNSQGRFDHWGHRYPSLPLDPVLVALVILACVVLLVPVVIFIATAVRFGGERRDRRLAALRLVGADVAMTRRTAAGEALFGALVGIVVGIGFFLAARQLFAVVEVWKLTAFPTDLSPVPALGLLVLVAVPLASVVVTVFALRSVAIEPLGVVRAGRPRPRRLWWRLLLPAAGAVLLLTTDAVHGSDTWGVVRIAGGSGLLLIGLVLILPWLVETVVNRLRGGSVPWQLATRRLQLSSTSASRAVAGITIAVAGGIALQMLMTAVDDDYTSATGQDTTRAQLSAEANVSSGTLARRMVDEFGRTQGVRRVIGSVDTWARAAGGKPDSYGNYPTVTISVGDCASLREQAKLTSCENGDVFRVRGGGDPAMERDLRKVARPGTRLVTDEAGSTPEEEKKSAVSWTLPKDTPTVRPRLNPLGDRFVGILATPAAFDTGRLHQAMTIAQIQIDRSQPDAFEYVRNTAARLDPTMRVYNLQASSQDKEFAAVQRGVFAGASVTVALIAASMLVSQIEQLRERRRLLSVLVAYGTRRSTLAWSVLWQTAIPVVLGMAVAVAGGLALGWLMLRLTARSVTDWLLFLPLLGVGAAAITAVTLLSLPPLYRLMRPEGLRTE